MAASRTFFASDPRMHREEEWTLSRTTSQQNTHHKKHNQKHEPRFEEEADSRISIENVTPPGERETVLQQRFVLPDPVAFRYLEDEPRTVVLERHGYLKGYQLYLVEQWACSRTHPTFVITTYTGDPNDSVIVGVLGVEGDRDAWSPRLQTYFQAINQFHARPKETPLGTVMVTNLSGFPSALTVIPVPEGDIKNHRDDFVVNENLKRLGCSGRSGLTLSPPTSATQAKFHQLYKTSDKIDLYKAVIEIVKLCQVALVMFDKLGQEYADGLLCDITERAINDWWTELGTEHYNIEPADGILGPTTVAALLGMFMGARNRLDYYGAPVGKDAFDIKNLKHGIGYFQKSQKLDKTRRLDRPTLACLRRVTAKAAAGEGWAVRKAVKSTVAELSGKGGEMVMGMVGAKDKAKIADIETIEIDRFVHLAYGDRSKWLWHGKHRHGTGDGFDKPLPETGSLVFSKDESGAYLWSTKKREQEVIEQEGQVRHKEVANDVYQNGPPPISETSMAGTSPMQDHTRRTVFKSAKDKMNDARSGLGRIKDAVGIRGHTSRQSRDDFMDGEYLTPSTANLTGSGSSTAHPGQLERSFTWKDTPNNYVDGYAKHNLSSSAILSASTPRQKTLSPYESKHSLPSSGESTKGADGENNSKDDAGHEAVAVPEQGYLGPPTDQSLAAEKTFDALQKVEVDSTLKTLLRRRSVESLPTFEQRLHDDAWWPRHLSFSAVSDTVLSWQDINAFDGSNVDASAAEADKQYLEEEEDRLFARIKQLEMYMTEWVERKITKVEKIEGGAVVDQTALQQVYNQLSEDNRDVQSASHEIIAEQRGHLMDSIQHIEGLGARLEYQINALESKVADVEDGVIQFQAQVDHLELHATELENLLQKESWMHWAVRTLTGIGSGPHA